MTFIERVTELSTRFLSDRAFALIVAPAIADFQYEERPPGRLAEARARCAVLIAVGGAFCNDARDGVSVLTLAGLTLIPFCYFGFMLALCAPPGVRAFASSETGVAFAVVILVLSPIPVIACCWPERERKPPAADVQ